MAVEEGAFLHAVSGRPVQRPPSEARGPRDTLLKVSTYGREQEVNHEDLELPVMGQLGAMLEKEVLDSKLRCSVLSMMRLKGKTEVFADSFIQKIGFQE